MSYFVTLDILENESIVIPGTIACALHPAAAGPPHTAAHLPATSTACHLTLHQSVEVPPHSHLALVRLMTFSHVFLFLPQCTPEVFLFLNFLTVLLPEKHQNKELFLPIKVFKRYFRTWLSPKIAHEVSLNAK